MDVFAAGVGAGATVGVVDDESPSAEEAASMTWLEPEWSMPSDAATGESEAGFGVP